MTLAVAATFGSLPEAHAAFSRLAAAGFNPVAGYNMNTPGSADGMAPSGYRVLAPEDEIEAVRAFLAELREAFAEGGEAEAADEGREARPSTTLGRMRRFVRYFVILAFVAWAVVLGYSLTRR